MLEDYNYEEVYNKKNPLVCNKGSPSVRQKDSSDLFQIIETFAQLKEKII